MDDAIVARPTGTIPNNLTFDIRAQRIRASAAAPPNSQSDHWIPPIRTTDFIVDWTLCYRWTGGRTEPMSPNTVFDDTKIVSEVTMFTGNPSSVFSAVSLDVTQENVPSSESWRTIHFDRKTIGIPRRHFEYVSPVGAQRRMHGTGNILQLFPACYEYADWDDQDNFINTDRRHRGFVGDTATLIAIAAFSGISAQFPAVMMDSLRANRWRPHSFETGQNVPRRGFVITIYTNERSGSTEDRIRKLENGRYGPFYRA